MARGREGWCEHYRGTAISDTCAAGVKYADVTDKSTKPHSLPCIEEWNLSGVKCDKCLMPTPEEVAAHKEEMRVRLEGIGKARAAIVAYLGGPWKKGMPAKSGYITCPVCEAASGLRFSRAGYNGHIHAKCITEGCVSWME